VAVALGSLGVLCFSFSLPATRLAVEDLDATFVGLGRAVTGAALGALLLVVLRQPRPRPDQVRRLGLVALGVVVGFPLFTALALRPLTSAHGAVIVGVLPAATAAMAVMRAAERPSRGFWIASGAGLVAVLAFAATQGAGGLQLADAYVLLAVALGALGYAEGGALAREIGGWQTISWALVLSMPVVAPFAAAAALTGDLHGGADAWLGFAYVGVISSCVGFFPWYAGLARGGVAKIGQVQLAQPVLTLVWAAALLGEEVNGWTVLAALAVLACVAGTQRTAVRRQAPAMKAVSSSTIM
jgi:drug/metabolite transporter (DMT)-like permease